MTIAQLMRKLDTLQDITSEQLMKYTSKQALDGVRTYYTTRATTMLEVAMWCNVLTEEEYNNLYRVYITLYQEMGLWNK